MRSSSDMKRTFNIVFFRFALKRGIYDHHINAITRGTILASSIWISQGQSMEAFKDTLPIVCNGFDLGWFSWGNLVWGRFSLGKLRLFWIPILSGGTQGHPGAHASSSPSPFPQPIDLLAPLMRTHCQQLILCSKQHFPFWQRGNLTRPTSTNYLTGMFTICKRHSKIHRHTLDVWLLLVAVLSGVYFWSRLSLNSDTPVTTHIQSLAFWEVRIGSFNPNLHVFIYFLCIFPIIELARVT